MTKTVETTITLKLNPRAMEVLEATAKIADCTSVRTFVLKAISCYVSGYIESYDSDYLDELFGDSEEAQEAGS